MKAYIAGVSHGRHEDYTEEAVFATEDKCKAEKWRDRFNGIISGNAERIGIMYEESSFTVKPFWYDRIYTKGYSAYVKEVEWR